MINFGYGEGTFAPGYTGHSDWMCYLVGHHLLLAHGHAYRAYEKFRESQKGKVKIWTINEVNSMLSYHFEDHP